MFAKLKRLFEIPDNHFTAKEIFQWLWRALQGNRLQAILNATIGLLFLIGANMIREALSQKEEESTNGALDFKTMFLLAVATSIDALAVGVSFACIQVKLWSSVFVIGLTTFAFSVLGVKIGNVFGSKYEKSAGIIGGIILIIIGLKILLEHLGVISF